MPAQNVFGGLNFSPTFTQIGVLGALAAFPTNQNLPSFTSIQYVNGTGMAFGVDQLYAATLTFVASTAQTFHFETSTLQDPFNNNISMLRIRELIVLNTSPTIGWDLSVAQAASNGIAWLPVVANAPPQARANGGMVRISDPQTFGAAVGNFITATTDGLVLTPTAHAVTAVILCLGCSVA
jgi:hypothetical protein